ncbi:MAG: AAA family ATPase [Pirellulales bacterium]|nr:AAA family ATPase [Pirellulales bacterium]
MKIEELEIRGRGPWEELSLTGLESRVNVIYGRNEAGKTSLLAALRGLLHGGQTGLPVTSGPLEERTCGGAFRAAYAGGRFAVFRTLDGGEQESHTAGSDRDEPAFAMVDGEGNRIGQSRYEDLLSGIDAATFDNIFACGLRELQQLASLEDGEAARMLHDLTAGLDRVNLSQLLRAVREDRDRLMDAQGAPSEISRLLDEHRELTSEIDRLSDSTQEYNRRLNERDSLAAKIGEMEADLAAADHRIALLRSTEGVQNAWTEQTSLRAELDALDEYRTVPADGPRRMKAANDRIAKLARRLRDLRAKRRKLQEEFEQFPDAGRLEQRAPEIEALAEQGEFIAAMEQQAATQRAAVKDLERQLDALLEQCGLSQSSWKTLATSCDRASFDKLRTLVKNLESDRAAVESAREEAIEAKRLAAEVSRKAQSGGPGEQQRAKLRSQAEEEIAQLRRRLELDERLEKLEEEAAELEEQATGLAEQGGLSTKQEWSVGGACAVGFVLAGGSLAGVLGASWWPFWLGIAIIGGAFGAKKLFERRNSLALEESENELDELQQEIEQAAKQREAFDRDLAEGGGSVAERLATAEAQIKELDNARALEADRASIEQAATNAEEQLDEAQRRLTRRKETWRKALRTFGLPEGLSPKQVGRLRNQWDHTRDLADRLDNAQSQWRQGESSRKALRQRIQDLAADLEISLTENDAQEQLASLRRELERQRGTLRRRSSLKLQLKKLSRSRKKVKSQLSLWRRRRRSVLTLAGAEDEADLRRRCEEAKRRVELTTRLAELKERIDSSLTQVSRDEVLSRLREFGVTGVTAELDELQSRADRLRGELQAMYDRRGWLTQVLPEMLEDQTLPQALLRKESVDQQIRGLLRQWRVLATVHFLLARIRSRYERERQPETLREASGYFRTITQGAYVRVWTPLDEDVLYVENDCDETIPLDQLSGGTREQLFLCLRLALVSGYAKRGIRLPIILDDVLVNFDARRARATTEVLRDFAERGHQVFLFTCHEHIARMFAEVKVRVWRISRHVNARRDRSLIHEVLGAASAEVIEIPQIEMPPPPIVMEETEPPLVILDEAPAAPEPEQPLADEPIFTGFIVDPTSARHAFDAEEFDGELQDAVFNTTDDSPSRTHLPIEQPTPDRTSHSSDDGIQSEAA